MNITKDFSFEKIGLDEADYRFVKDLKPSVWLKKARTEGGYFLRLFVYEYLKNEDRSAGLKPKNRRYHEAREISWRIYGKMIEAGFVRTTSSCKNLHDFIDFFEEAEHYRAYRFRDDDLFWLDSYYATIHAIGHDIYELMADGYSYLSAFVDKIPTPARLANSKLYETYNFTELDNAVGKVLSAVLTQSQRAVLERVVFGDREFYYTLVLTKEETTLYKTGIASLILNAQYIEKKLSPYIPELLKRKK